MSLPRHNPRNVVVPLRLWMACPALKQHQEGHWPLGFQFSLRGRGIPFLFLPPGPAPPLGGISGLDPLVRIVRSSPVFEVSWFLWGILSVSGLTLISPYFHVFLFLRQMINLRLRSYVITRFGRGEGETDTDIGGWVNPRGQRGWGRRSAGVCSMAGSKPSFSF